MMETTARITDNEIVRWTGEGWYKQYAGTRYGEEFYTWVKVSDCHADVRPKPVQGAHYLEEPFNARRY